MISKTLKLLLCSFSLILIIGWIVNKYHPIIKKWIIGTAWIVGKPTSATIYTNGQLNSGIKSYKVINSWHGQKGEAYVLQLPEYDKDAMLKFVYVSLTENWVGRPVCTSLDCYDIINGQLYQSESGGTFTPFQDDIKGYNFDPQLVHSKNLIKFKFPPGLLKFDSIRIELSN
jgi:hypothetical protein